MPWKARSYKPPFQSQRAPDRRPSAARRGYGAEWREARAAFLRANPLCADCGQPATVVDHVEPHKGDLGLFWAQENWAARCKRCHDRKTATRDGGFGRKPKA